MSIGINLVKSFCDRSSLPFRQPLRSLPDCQRWKENIVPHPPEEMFLNVGPDDFTCKHRDKLGRKLLSLLMTRLGYHGVQKARSTRSTAEAVRLARK